MEPQNAIRNIKRRLEYENKKVEEFKAKGANTFNRLQDVAAFETAIAALEFVIATNEYESSQTQK